jgi:hypothetical protein
VHVPLVIRVPGGLRNSRRPELVELVDVLPTLLSLWGVPAGQWPPLDGRSLVPLLRRADGSGQGGGGGAHGGAHKRRGRQRRRGRQLGDGDGGGDGGGGGGGGDGGGGGGGGAFPLTFSGSGPWTQRAYVRSMMRHPMNVNGRWVCGEQHYLRTAQHSFVTYLHAGVVVNASMFDLTSDPYEQRNLMRSAVSGASSQAKRAEFEAWEISIWPRHEVTARDAARAAAGSERCEEHRRRRRLFGGHQRQSEAIRGNQRLFGGKPAPKAKRRSNRQRF